MARPKYETAEDLAYERRIADVLCQKLGCEAAKMPLNSRADFVLLRDGEAKTIVEIKRRHNSRWKYETYMVSKGKYDTLLRWVDKGFKAALVVCWTDQIAYVMLPVEHTTDVGGRRDRGDTRDIEKVVHINADAFTTLLDGSLK